MKGEEFAAYYGIETRTNVSCYDILYDYCITTTARQDVQITPDVFSRSDNSLPSFISSQLQEPSVP